MNFPREILSIMVAYVNMLIDRHSVIRPEGRPGMRLNPWGLATSLRRDVLRRDGESAESMARIASVPVNVSLAKNVREKSPLREKVLSSYAQNISVSTRRQLKIFFELSAKEVFVHL